MKKTLLIIALSGFYAASAQDNDLLNLEKRLKENGIRKKESSKVIINPIADLRQIPKRFSARLSHTLPNGNKVYSLPQDNMPCVVPDMSQYNMYNAAKTFRNSTVFRPFHRNMPNAVTPYTIIPPQ